MRSSWMIFMVAIAFAMPRAASADDAQVEEQLRQMQERLMLLEDKLDNTSEKLDAAKDQVNEQKQVMSNAGLHVDPGASSVDSFLQSLEIGGWVNVSYWHNFNNPSNGECFAAAGFGPPAPGPGLGAVGGCGPAGAALPASLNANTGNAATAAGATTGLPFLGFFNPTNPDSQGFSFDQLWFEVERPVSPEQRSGFRADITFGKIADLLAHGGARNARSDDDIYIHQANIQYLWDAPWLGETKLTLGKFATLIGYEVAQAAYNHNISRSVLWGLLQPVDHLGFLMSGTIDRPYHLFGVEGNLDWDFGVVNGFHTDDPDLNHSKTWTGRIRMTGENWSIAVAGISGAEDGAPVQELGPVIPVVPAGFPNGVPTNAGVGGSENENVTLVDVIMTWDPFTDLNLWLDFDRMWVDANGTNPTAWGLSVGGHYTINERTAFTLRTEFMQWNDPAGNFLGFTNIALPFAGRNASPHFGTDADIVSLTATLHYQLTDQITVRGEMRWDTLSFDARSNNIGLLATDSLFNEGAPDGNAAANVHGGDSDQLVAGIDVIYEF